MATTLYWHDYETWGADPRRDRPAQFAGIRTDTDLNIIGKTSTPTEKAMGPDDVVKRICENLETLIKNTNSSIINSQSNEKNQARIWYAAVLKNIKQHLWSL